MKKRKRKQNFKKPVKLVIQDKHPKCVLGEIKLTRFVVEGNTLLKKASQLTGVWAIFLQIPNGKFDTFGHKSLNKYYN